MLVTSRSIIAAAALAAASTAAPQGVVTQRLLSLDAARAIAETALTACTSRGFRTSDDVVDRSGNLLDDLRPRIP
jgi:hypothetical protein